MASAQQPPIERVLQHRISPERLAPYIRETSSLQEAIRLYLWNIDLSGAVYEALHVFEVVLRNAIDAELCKWNASQPDPDTGRLHSSDWLIDPSALLLRVAGRDIPEARRRALKSTKRRPQAAGPARATPRRHPCRNVPRNLALHPARAQRRRQTTAMGRSASRNIPPSDQNLARARTRS